jgi:hypothetical protein
MSNVFFTLGCGVVVALAGTLMYQYNKPPRDVTAETGIPVTATELYATFTSNEPQANQVYLNKVLQVSGQVLEVKTIPNSGRVVVLNTGDPMFGVACKLNKVENTSRPVKPGEKITIKGICTGYLSDVVLTNSCLIN